MITLDVGLFEIVALIGALTGCASLAFGMLKWWFYERVNLYIEIREDQGAKSKFFQVLVTNHGGRPVFLHRLHLVHYPDFLSFILRRNNHYSLPISNQRLRRDYKGITAIYPEFAEVKPPVLPKKLDVGDFWGGLVMKDQDLLNRIKSGRVYAHLGFTGKKRGKFVRLTFKKEM